jgi:asparagine synthase (glutamine-hydrolysing)
MCGIAGWVDFGDELAAHGGTSEAVASAMTDTMACRGPDASGLWLGAQAALGHRRLAVIDLESGDQPMEASQGNGASAVISYSGEVYNFRELRRELEAHGRSFRTRSDTEVVLQGYLQWERDVVHRLNGMYAFALWDGARRELLLARDRMGIKPLYYAPLHRGLLFGSEPKAILANPAFTPAVDLDGLREALAMIKTPGHAVWRGMRELRPGSLVVAGAGGVHEEQYWRLEGRPHGDDLQSTVRTVRELLEDILERQLISDVPLCCLLSGGLDSSVVTAIAADRLRRQGGGPVRSFAVDFSGYAAGFQPDAMRDTPDAPFVRDVAAHVEADHTDVVLDNRHLLDPDARWAVLRARDMPVTLGDLDTSLYLLFRAIREHSTVALSGESADEVFGGYRWFHDPAIVATPTFPWLLAVPSDGRLGVLDPALARSLDLQGYVDQRYRDALAEVPVVDGEQGQQRRMREISYLHLTRMLQVLLDRKDRMSMAVGLEVRVPFCDHRLVEYVFNAPWEMKTFDGHEKSLLRAATADLLPRSVVERRKSPYPSTQDPGYDASLRAEIGRIAGDPGAPVRDLTDAGRLRELAAATATGIRAIVERMELEQVLALNTWLTRYQPRLLL